MKPWIAILAAAALACEPAPAPPKPAKSGLEGKVPIPPTMATGLTSRTVVLTYHDMVPERTPEALWFDCTPEELRQQVQWLKEQGAVFISLDELRLGLIGSGSLPQGAVAITFADNYRGFLDHAWPILKEEEIPVTMFVHTGHVGGTTGRPKMTWDELKLLLENPLFSVQSQTVSHPKDITQLSQEDKMAEFSESRAAIKENLGVSASMVAYPNGKFDNETAQAAKEAGYFMAFTEELAIAETAPSLHLVPRWVHTRYEDAWRAANPG